MVEQHAAFILVSELLPIHGHMKLHTLPLLDVSVLSDTIEHQEHVVSSQLQSDGL